MMYSHNCVLDSKSKSYLMYICMYYESFLSAVEEVSSLNANHLGSDFQNNLHFGKKTAKIEVVDGGGGGGIKKMQVFPLNGIFKVKVFLRHPVQLNYLLASNASKATSYFEG